VGRVQLPSSLRCAAHGNNYRGEEKGSFLCGVLRHGEYHVMLVMIFFQNLGVGLGNPKPWHPQGWMQGLPLCGRARKSGLLPRWPSWWESSRYSSYVKTRSNSVPG